MSRAILLAGGAGRKFWPYNEARNKCAFPICNVPLVRRLAKQLLALGFEGLVVVTGPRAGSIRAALHGLEAQVALVSQPEPTGTADAALLGWEALGVGDLPVLVAAADVCTADENLAAFWKGFQASDALAGALVQPLGEESPSDWLTGEVKDGALTGIRGHSRGGSHRLTGVYGFRRDAHRWLVTNPGIMRHVSVGGMPTPEAEIAESLARMTDEGEPVLAVETPGFHVDLDKPWHILEASRALLRDHAARLDGDEIADGCKVHDSAEIHGKLCLQAGAEIGRNVVVKGDLWLGAGASVTNGAIVGGRTMLDRDARVRDYAMLSGDSVMGREGLLGHGGEFGGVLLEGAYLYHYCEISGVVGAKVDIGAATVCGTLRFDDGAARHRILGRSERPLTGANATYFGDYSRTGVNAILMPGVKLGTYSCVGPGVVLYEDLPSRQMVLVKQELEVREWGPERYGW